VPPGTLPDADDALAAMAGVRRDVWGRMREQALTGFELCSDGKLHHTTLEAKAITMLAEVEKRERRKADDRRRQMASYYRKKAKQTGNGTPEPPSETVAAPLSEVSIASPPSAPHNMSTAPSQSNEPATSCGDAIRDAKSHGVNGQAAPTSSPHEAMSKIEPTTKPTIVEWNTHVKNYRVHGHWSWRELGPSPQSPGCRAPSFVLIRHGYREAQA
jgi:hypothetical protein